MIQATVACGCQAQLPPPVPASTLTVPLPPLGGKAWSAGVKMNTQSNFGAAAAYAGEFARVDRSRTDAINKNANNTNAALKYLLLILKLLRSASGTSRGSLALYFAPAASQGQKFPPPNAALSCTVVTSRHQCQIWSCSCIRCAMPPASTISIPPTLFSRLIPRTTASSRTA